MKKIFVHLGKTLLVVSALAFLPLSALVIGSGQPTITTQQAPASFVAVNYDYVDPGSVMLIPATGVVQTQDTQVVWSQDRYILGWSPWIGWDRGAIMESHLALFVGSKRVFLRGAHKENSSVFYDEAKSSEFFPSGYGFLVPAGTPVILQFSCHSTGQIIFNSRANAVVYSVNK